MQVAIPELVTDALDFRGERAGQAAAHLETIGLHPRQALRLALEVIVEQRREIATLTENAEEAWSGHVDLATAVERWRAKHPDADPEEELAAILEDNPPFVWW
ncbi:MAG TPA: hypothetical protein VKA39_00335 [Beijerinckiaceae bacterium]|nr:hypothetical protein [Beijerinckiaceae bacterium]